MSCRQREAWATAGKQIQHVIMGRLQRHNGLGRGFLRGNAPEVKVEKSGLNVQYGCGLCAPDGWLSFDCSPTLRLQRLPLVGGIFRSWLNPRFPDRVQVGDIRRGLPLTPHSVHRLYCSHVLEHLSLADFRLALRNSRQLVQHGGIFRLVLPDLRNMAEYYVANPGPEAAVKFISDTGLGSATRPKGLVARLRGAFGNSEHLWMWDFDSLRHELAMAGFSAIRRAEYLDSNEDAFAAVEHENRWTGQLGVECRG